METAITTHLNTYDSAATSGQTSYQIIRSSSQTPDLHSRPMTANLIVSWEPLHSM